MPLHIVSADITRLHVDAIVNAANRELRNYATRRGGGVCGAIFRAAGHDAMQPIRQMKRRFLDSPFRPVLSLEELIRSQPIHQ